MKTKLEKIHKKDIYSLLQFFSVIAEYSGKEFAIFVLDNLESLETELESIKNSLKFHLESDPEFLKYTAEESRLIKSFGKKDPNGNYVRDERSGAIIIDNEKAEEFGAARKEFEEKFATMHAEFLKFKAESVAVLNKPSDSLFSTISMDNIPNEINANDLKFLKDFGFVADKSLIV